MPSRQIRHFAQQSHGHYKITAAHSGKALDVGGCSTAAGADVITWHWLANDCQKWDVVDVGGDYYGITAKNSGKSLDVANCSTANGADAIVRSYTGADCHRWRIETTP